MTSYSRINKTKKRRGVQAELPREFIQYFDRHANEAQQMESIKQAAETHEDVNVKNVADLDKVSVDIELKEEVVDEGKPTEWMYKYFEQNGERYKIPLTVLSQLKDHLAQNPDLKFFRVNKKGEGLKSKYTTIPLNDKK